MTAVTDVQVWARPEAHGHTTVPDDAAWVRDVDWDAYAQRQAAWDADPAWHPGPRN